MFRQTKSRRDEIFIEKPTTNIVNPDRGEICHSFGVSSFVFSISIKMSPRWGFDIIVSNDNCSFA
jgi:hypothetical protein